VIARGDAPLTLVAPSGSGVVKHEHYRSQGPVSLNWDLVYVVRLCYLRKTAIAGGCAGPMVKTDFDLSGAFSGFRTFDFSGLTDRDQGGVLDKSLVRKRIGEMAGQQQTAKALGK
jgi:hypothetical protein